MTIDVSDALMPVALAAVFLVLGWTSTRSINGGRPLNRVQRGMLAYGSSFVLGAGYLAFVGSLLHLKSGYWVALIAGWGAILGYIAWRRYKHHRATSPNVSNPARRGSNLRQGFAVVALLISLVMSSVEWDVFIEHQGHLVAALLCSAAVVGSILLAYGNRRTTVIVTLRAYLVLVVIGAITERKEAGLIFAAIAGAIYLLLEKLWKKPQPPVLDFEALSHGSDAGSAESHATIKRQ